MRHKYPLDGRRDLMDQTSRDECRRKNLIAVWLLISEIYDEEEGRRESAVVCAFDTSFSEHIKIELHCNDDIDVSLYLKTGRCQRRHSRRKNFPATGISYRSLFFVTSVYMLRTLYDRNCHPSLFTLPLYGQNYLPFSHTFHSNCSFHHLFSLAANVAVSQRFLHPSDITGRSQEPRDRSAEFRWPANVSQIVFRVTSRTSRGWNWSWVRISTSLKISCLLKLLPAKK